MQELVAQYEERLREMQLIPRLSYGRRLLRRDGAPNRTFLTSLFIRHELAIEFLKDVGLIPSRVPCNICERDMTWTADPTRNDGFRWRCRRSVARVRCRGTASIRHGSWFKLSNLTLWEIMNITYDILRRDPAHQIEETGMVTGINHHSVAGVTHASPSMPIVLLLSPPRPPTPRGSSAP